MKKYTMIMLCLIQLSCLFLLASEDSNSGSYRIESLNLNLGQNPWNHVIHTYNVYFGNISSFVDKGLFLIEFQPKYSFEAQSTYQVGQTRNRVISYWSVEDSYNKEKVLEKMRQYMMDNKNK